MVGGQGEGDQGKMGLGVVGGQDEGDLEGGRV